MGLGESWKKYGFISKADRFKAKPSGKMSESCENLAQLSVGDDLDRNSLSFSGIITTSNSEIVTSSSLEQETPLEVKGPSLDELQRIVETLSSKLQSLEQEKIEKESHLEMRLMESKHRIATLERIIEEERMERQKMEAGFTYTKEELLGKLRCESIEKQQIDVLDSLIERINMAFYVLEQKNKAFLEEQARMEESSSLESRLNEEKECLQKSLHSLRLDLSAAEKQLLDSEANFCAQLKELMADNAALLEREKILHANERKLCNEINEKCSEIKELVKEKQSLLLEQAEWKRFYNLEMSAKMKRLEEDLNEKNAALTSVKKEFESLQKSLKEEKEKYTKIKAQFKEELNSSKIMKKKELADKQEQIEFLLEKVKFLQELSDKCCNEKHSEQISHLIEQNAHLLNQQVSFRQKEASLRTEISVVLREKDELEESLSSMNSMLEAEREKRNLLVEKVRELDRQASLNYRNYFIPEE